MKPNGNTENAQFLDRGLEQHVASVHLDALIRKRIRDLRGRYGTVQLLI